MPTVFPLSDKIFRLGVDDWETERFENLWPLPSGITYNSYLVVDRKVALIDTVKEAFTGEFLAKIDAVLPAGRAIDYLVINHMEPDHSGGIKQLLARYPAMRIVGNPKTAGFLEQFYAIRDNVRLVDDGDTLALGQHSLRFCLTPMVHWPETMMSFETGCGILFSGDVFGSFGALDGGVFDDTLFGPARYEDEILRYFTNVIGRYSTMVQKALARIAGLEISTIAPTHGPVWRRDPGRVRSLYARWSRHETEPGVVIAYGSMYGNTGAMAEAVGEALARQGVSAVTVHNVSKSHASFILRDIWRRRALVLGTPTYNMKPFPGVDSLVRMLQNKMMRNRLLGIFGSYGWSGGGVKALTGFAENDPGWELVGPVVEAHCAPKDDDLEQCRKLGKNLAHRLTAPPEG